MTRTRATRRRLVLALTAGALTAGALPGARAAESAPPAQAATAALGDTLRALTLEDQHRRAATLPGTARWPLFAPDKAAADIAVTGTGGPALMPRHVAPQRMLEGVIKAGAKVEVCTLCRPNSRHRASDPIQGVAPATPVDVAAHLFKPGVRPLPF